MFWWAHMIRKIQESSQNCVRADKLILSQASMRQPDKACGQKTCLHRHKLLNAHQLISVYLKIVFRIDNRDIKKISKILLDACTKGIPKNLDVTICT